MTTTPFLFFSGGVPLAGRMHRDPAAGVERQPAVLVTGSWLTVEEQLTVPAYDPDDERAGMPMPLPYYAESDRGRVPAWRNEMAEMSWRPWLTFDGPAAAGTATVPAHFVHGDGAVLPDNVRAIAARVGAGTTWLDGDQIDCSDQPAQVDAAVEAADAHFRVTR